MKIYWCKTCQTPMTAEKCGDCGHENLEIGQDLRPVFPEEALLLEILLHKEGKLRNSSIWKAKGNYYIVDGQRMAFPVNKIITEWNPGQVRVLWDQVKLEALDALYPKFNGRMNRFVEANRQRLQEIDYQAIEFVRTVKADHFKRSIVVSFSGGKDSTVVSSLVRRALGSSEIIHVFGDTTLELPSTYKYIEDFRRRNRKIPFFKPRSPHEFLELSDRIGPPSRVMRWCCTVFKTSPISDVMERFSGDTGILTFYGVRRSESVRRSHYEAVADSPKIANQIVASPIIDWFDFDIWLYLFGQDEPFNDAYRQGFPRVGCWCCPSNSDWSYFLSQIVNPTQAQEWNDFLVAFARRIGKPDAEEYVASGNWKARQGGRGMHVPFNTVRFEPCATEIHARNYQLTRPISRQLYEFFKPFGRLDFSGGKKLLGEVRVLDRQTNEPVLILQGREGQNHLKVIAQPANFRLVITRVECQIKKYQSCVGCGGCPPVCHSQAIRLIGDEYVIHEDRCVGCMECIGHYDQGCLVAKVTKDGGKAV